MYVRGTEACSLPNSETPMSQDAIDQQSAFGQTVGTAFEQGNDALNSMLQELGGNPAGATLEGASGVPTTGSLDTDYVGIPVVPYAGSAPPMALLPDINNPGSWAWQPSPNPQTGQPQNGNGYGRSPFSSDGPGFQSGLGQAGFTPSPASPIVVPGGGAGYRAPQGEQRTQGQRRRYTNAPKHTSVSWQPPANCPTVVPLVTAIPIPGVSGEVPVNYRGSGVAMHAGTGSPGVQLPSSAGGANIPVSGLVAPGPGPAAAPGPAYQAETILTPGNPYGIFPNVPANYAGFGPQGMGQANAAAQATNADVFSNAFEYAISGLIAVIATALFVKMRRK